MCLFVIVLTIKLVLIKNKSLMCLFDWIDQVLMIKWDQTLRIISKRSKKEILSFATLIFQSLIFLDFLKMILFILIHHIWSQYEGMRETFFASGMQREIERVIQILWHVAQKWHKICSEQCFWSQMKIKRHTQRLVKKLQCAFAGNRLCKLQLSD